MRRTWGTWGLLALLGSGCDAIDLSEITQRDATTRVHPEPAGEHCPLGGQAVLTGLDRDRDGELDDTEVTATHYVCDRAPPEVRTRTRAEPHGGNCALGGQAVQSGLDRNASGQLDDAEVTTTDYVCATAVANVLVRVRPVPPGAQCARGGQVTHAGHDANGNGLLEDAEISREVYGCDERAPVLSRVRELPSSVAPCDRGGAVVEAGADLDLDGTLDAEELDATAYACDVAPAYVKRVHYAMEPGGMNCPTGGTGVNAFEDADGDGSPDANAFQTTVYVCQASRIHDGDFVVTSAVDLVALQGVGRLRGTLRIEAPTLTEAILPTLPIIDGSLVVQGNSSLRRLFLTSLRFVGGSVELRDNARLDGLGLGDDTRGLLRVAGSLVVENNPALPDLLGLVAVVPAHGISLRANNAIVQPGPLPNVVSLQGSLVIEDHLQLDRTPFIHLAHVHGNVLIVNNAKLPGPFGLDQLLTVDGELELRDNPVLEVLHPLARLTSVGDLHILGNARLPDTTGFAQLARARRVLIQGNPVMTGAGDMPLLAQVERDFSVKYNAGLQRVHDLPQLRSVSVVSAVGNGHLMSLEAFHTQTRLDTLEVLGNARLTALGDFPALRHLDFLNVQGNEELTDLGLGELARVLTNFVVVDNVKLPTCKATALATRAFQGEPAGLHIDLNDDTATCP
ncbi:hypothetical protein G4177_03925 [Corallococcus sp. ZKHCc1 1396]|uniref:DUF7151 domain-containing protein n=1 Tax=Corallococcus soli TaxID=2710757 RepID=A0ABR9PHJ4_9BACT|nr:hypothetical protein [Corallococcus soli]MBE4747324.1 hypothetical protein [Corallococcus soli]